MFLEVKKVLLSVKYALMKEMLNKATFISNIVFMFLNNAAFIIEWQVFFSLSSSFGSYTMHKVLLLWSLAAGIYGISNFFFRDSYFLSDIISDGRLDTYLVQPRNVLINSITGNVSVSSIGDIIYSIIILLICKPSFYEFILFIFFTIIGALVLTSFVVILGSLAFFIKKSDMISDSMTNLVISFSTYPGSIFKGVTKLLLYTIVPVGIISYMPVEVISNFNLFNFLIIIAYAVFMIFLAFYIFNKGLKRYSSSNLMVAKL